MFNLNPNDTLGLIFATIFVGIPCTVCMVVVVYQLVQSYRFVRVMHKKLAVLDTLQLGDDLKYQWAKSIIYNPFEVDVDWLKQRFPVKVPAA